MKRLLARLKKDERGLTLVELLAVVVILAIVGGIAFVMIGNVIENSKKDAHVANALQMISAARFYEATTGEEITEVSATVLQGTGTDAQGQLIGTLIDPWTKKAYGALNNAKVTKDSSGVYTAILTADGDKCAIDDTEADLIEKGKKVCDDPSTGG